MRSVLFIFLVLVLAACTLEVELVPGSSPPIDADVDGTIDAFVDFTVDAQVIDAAVFDADVFDETIDAAVAIDAAIDAAP